MTIQQADQWLAAREPGYAGAEAVRAAAFDAAQSRVKYIGIAGTAGKTAVASGIAAILRAAGFVTGLYTIGPRPFSARVTLNGDPAGELCAKAVSAVAAGEALPQAEAELACACRCFELAGCAYAVVELADGGLGAALPQMPVCAVTAIGPDGSGHTLERLAHFAADVQRSGSICVTDPEQPKEALSEIIVTAAQTGCELVVPDKEDVSFLEAQSLASHVDYGGYELHLSTLGRNAAYNAAVAVELALALWRRGTEIPDEAILEGLNSLPAADSIRIAKRDPLVILDACHTPQQAQALVQVLSTARLERLSAIIGLTKEEGAEEFLTALETGFLPKEKNGKKEVMPGMAEHPFERVYLVTPKGSDPTLIDRIGEKAKFHFDLQLWDALDEALEEALGDQGGGVLICGSAQITAEAAELLTVQV